jgi:hypothetical protein
VPLVCNPHGYHQHGQRENLGFDPLAIYVVGAS